MSPGASQTLERLREDGLLQRNGTRYRTTRRWQAAMARAALRLGESTPRELDLRVPITVALLELRSPGTPAETIAAEVDAILPIEIAELEPWRGAPAER